MVLNKRDLLQHILQSTIHFDELLALGLPRRDFLNQTQHTKEELIEGQLKTLMLLVENKSPNLELLLNRYHDFISKKLIQKLLPLVARHSFADYFLP